MTHRNVEIAFDEKSGAFTATLNGERIRVTSLPAMKKQIDKRLDSGFVPFKIIITSAWSADIEKTVVEKKIVRDGYNSGFRFIDNSGDKHRVVIVANDRNKGIIDHYRTRTKEIREIKGGLDKELRYLWATLETVNADGSTPEKVNP